MSNQSPITSTDSAAFRVPDVAANKPQDASEFVLKVATISETTTGEYIVDKAKSRRWFTPWRPTHIALLFGVAVWTLVTFAGGMVVKKYYDESVRQADERVTLIFQQIVRSTPNVQAQQAEAMSASARNRLFLVTVTTPARISEMRPEDIPANIWARWFAPPIDSVSEGKISRRDGYIFATARAYAADGTPLLVNVAQVEAKSLASYYPLRDYAIGIFTIFSLGIIAATAILMRSLNLQQRTEAALKQSESSLLVREADLLAAQNIAKFGSWRIDLANGAMHPSPEYLALFEMTAETAPRNLEEWIRRFLPDRENASIARQRFLDARKADFAYEGTRRVVLDSGKVKWMQFYARPLMDKNGKHRAYLGVTRDVTEEHIAAQKLAASEERYRLISENMHDIVTLHAKDTTLLYASPSLNRLISHDNARAIGKSPLPYIHHYDIARVNAALALLREDLEQLIKVEFRIRGKGGEYHWLETSLVAVLRSDKTLRHVQAISRDITTRKAIELSLARRTEQLSAANRQLMREVERRQALERRVMLDIEMELAQVGLELHDDLGQDLTGIALLTKTLERKLSDAGLSTAEDAARISDLVNRAIRHTRMISHGLSPYVWGESGLIAALAQLASDIDSLGAVSCIAKLDENTTINDEVIIRSLYRIAQEATNNALKHSQARHIRIGLKRLPNHIQLIIADDGITQNNGSRHRLVAHASKAEGSGLHSIRHRAQAIDAHVNVRISPGRGTAILVTLSNSKLGARASAPPIQEENMEPTQPHTTRNSIYPIGSYS
jgi:PAS domain S-box-containing protein